MCLLTRAKTCDYFFSFANNMSNDTCVQNFEKFAARVGRMSSEKLENFRLRMSNGFVHLNCSKIFALSGINAHF